MLSSKTFNSNGISSKQPKTGRNTAVNSGIGVYKAPIKKHGKAEDPRIIFANLVGKLYPHHVVKHPIMLLFYFIIFNYFSF